jgi:hypothetical protein
MRAESEDDSTETSKSRKMVCTGETMQDVVLGLFPGLKATAFRPQHTGRLDNAYMCLADFDLKDSS